MIALFLVACLGFSPTPTAASELAVEVTITTPPPTGALSGDLVVQGTATAGSGAALLQVTFGGVQATAVTGNYATWTATVPRETLVSLTGGTEGSLTLCAEAIDLYGNRTAADAPACLTLTVAAETDSSAAGTSGESGQGEGGSSGGEGSGGEGSGGEGSGGEGSGGEGSGGEGSGGEGSGGDGSGGDGSGGEGSGGEGSGSDGSGGDGSGGDGSGTDGSGTDGSGTDGSA